MEDIELIIEEYRKRFVLLKEQASYFDPQELLSLSKEIKKNIASNADLQTLENVELIKLRDTLVGDISAYQEEIILGVTNAIEIKLVDPNSEIKNFQQAKDSLYSLATEEIHLVDETLVDFPVVNALKNHRVKLVKVADNCSNEKYKVCVLGEFQIGKTTLINAICDGRYIGSIGGGLATSAVPISVDYCENDSFNIVIKAWGQLKHIIAHLQAHLDDFNVEHFNIHNPHNRESLQDALECYRENPECNTVSISELKFIVLSAIILKYFGTKELSDYLNSVKLYDIPFITKFPDDLESRWKRNGINDFSLNEIAFVFIDQVEFFCNSETLKHLNCVITDCPGLFNSEYDTAITSENLAKADAILYLLPYTKGAGDFGWAPLEKIKIDFRDCHRKLFIVNNLTIYADNDEFYYSNLMRVKNLFGEHQDLIRVDALLAYLGSIKKAHELGILTKEDENLFIANTKKPNRRSFGNTKNTGTKSEPFTNFDDAWFYRTRDYRIHCDWNDNITSDEIIENSGMKCFINGLRAFIENNRAYSLIVSEGINQLISDHLDIRHQLFSCYIETYLKGRDSASLLWDSRINNAILFNQIIPTIVHEHLFGSRAPQINLVSSISHEVSLMLFTDELFDSLSKDICVSVYENKKQLFKLRNKKDEFQRFLVPIINDIISYRLGIRLSYWNTLLKEEKESTFTSVFVKEMNELENKLANKWAEVYHEDSGFKDKMKTYLNIPKDSKGFFVKSHSHGSSIDINMKTLTGALLAEVATITTGCAMVIAGIIANLFSTAIATGVVSVINPVAFIVSLIVLLGGGITLLLAGPNEIKKHFINKVQPKVKDSIKNNGLFSKLETTILIELTERFQELQSSIKCEITKMENDKLIATSSSDEEIERIGILAVGTIHKFNTQYAMYQQFKEENINEGT